MDKLTACWRAEGPKESSVDALSEEQIDNHNFYLNMYRYLFYFDLNLNSMLDLYVLKDQSTTFIVYCEVFIFFKKEESWERLPYKVVVVADI